MTSVDATIGQRRDKRKASASSHLPDAHKAAENVVEKVNVTALVLQTTASLLWIPQAGLLSISVGTIAAGAGFHAALWPALGIFLLGALRAIADGAGARLAFRDARSRLSGMREKAVETAASASPLDTGRAASGLVASTLAEQAEAVVPYVAKFRPARFKAMIVPLVILACVFALSWTAALILLVAAPLIPIFMALVGWRAKEASERQLAEMGDMNAFLLDRLRGLATIRSFGAVDGTATRLRRNAEDLRRRTMAVLRIAFLSSAVLELFSALGVAMVAVYVGFHLLGELDFGAWGGKLSLAQGLFILLLSPAFFEPLRELSAVWHDRASGKAALEALQKLAAPGRPLPDALSAAPLAQAETPALSVTVEDLRFRFDEEAPLVFDAFSLDVKPGERIALLAPSGGGKSTLLALLAGLAKADAGTIRIGGEPMQERTAAKLRSQMAWVSQEPHLFAGTLLSNITLGRPLEAATVEKAIAAARLAPLAAARGNIPIGENGLGLSGGEALRLALARAAASPGAGLILADEPTAHLDSTTASGITQTLLDISVGRTLIVATHDPELASRMDRVIVLGQPVIQRSRP
ncbi:ATP-binding/permease cydD [Nitratireductor indicus C115]|uniref:ATP-binding/permease cydD n=1 Tax=Nitratireductor indicus C115 TaxID=1231190 RepID=K2N563_9HYPH|nr:thiol reductant ABC exporter subunit CydD [Nitratireductor indicus]EKF42538.1 ATP-binding/permease cydD [Nitratireductor indicus C115]SFQ57112.1 ATP-binding cassette, subfamily C, CydD [Nitratireductor indicus]